MSRIKEIKLVLEELVSLMLALELMYFPGAWSFGCSHQLISKATGRKTCVDSIRKRKGINPYLTVVKNGIM
jgi:hypothetical protein